MPPGFPSDRDRAAVEYRRPPFRFCTTLLLAGLVALGAAAPAGAAEELWLRWNGCALDGAPAQLHTCAGVAFPRDLYAAATPGADVTQVVGAILVIDVVVAAPTLPDWWLMAPGQCRAGALVADTDQAAGSSCSDAWQGAGVALVASLGPREGSAASDVRAIITTTLPSNSDVTLSEGTTYHLAHVLLRTYVNGASGLCDGCTMGACLVLNSVQLLRLPGAPGGDVTLVQPAPSNGNYALWHGGAGCATVPSRNRTWGQIKAMYR